MERARSFGAGIAISIAMVTATAWAVEPAPATVSSNQEILVTATRTEQGIREVPSSVEVIDSEVIEAANAANVEDLLKTTVGVDMQGGGFPGEATKINMRGMSTGYQSERVLVLVDGRRINDQYQGNTEFAMLPIDNVERIEILRGPASALYGSNAEGGVINIITRKGTTTPFTRVAASAGSYNTQRYAVSHGWKTGPFDYFLTGSYLDTDGYTHNSDGTERDWTAQNFTGNFGYTLNDDAEIRTCLGSYAGEGTDENSDRTARKDYEAVTCSWRWDRATEARLVVRGYRNWEYNRYDWKYPGESVYDQNTLGGEVQQSLWIGEHHQATVGVEARRDSVDADEVQNRFDESSTTVGSYLQDEIRINESWQLTAGVRNDSSSDYSGEWSPRLAALYRMGPQAEVFASVNRAYRAPALSDRFVKTEWNGIFFEGNPDLKPETLMAYELGARRRMAERISVEVAVFASDMKDTFDFVLNSDGVFRNQNVTRSKIMGVESRVEYQMTKEFSAFANYTFTDGTYDEFPPDPVVEGNELAYLAKNRAGAGLSYRRDSGLSTAVEGRYVGSRYGDAQNLAANKMGDYLVADWRLRVPVADHTLLTFNVNNIFDESYQDFPGVSGPGITVMGGVELTF